ncbi:MAG: DUF86 domain-containing protein [Saprospiraceae bacterium]|jgi:uncharacterized protein with HEPN domain
MAKRQLNVYLTDIIDSIEIIEQFTAGVSPEEFEYNIEKQDAVLRRLTVIGEAIKHVPQEIRAKFPNVPWRDAAGLRDIVVHEYFGVSLEVIWNVAVKELPSLKDQIELVKAALNT